MSGVRDHGALESAWSSAENTYHYQQGDIYDSAASYAFGLSENQPFIEGNKRVGLLAAETFLIWNGCIDCSDDGALYDAMIAISARKLDKAGLADGLRRQFPKP